MELTLKTMGLTIILVTYGIDDETIHIVTPNTEARHKDKCAAPRGVVSKEQVEAYVARRLVLQKIMSWYAVVAIYIRPSHANRLQRLDQRHTRKLSISKRHTKN